MNFDELDEQMRKYECLTDVLITPGTYMVVRLDGRGFTKLTKHSDLQLSRPFDKRFNDAMVAALKALMDDGFNVVYGFTQSDEISILLHLGDSTFNRKERKIITSHGSTASANFTHAIGKPGPFDGRISQLPNIERVVDYFRWRQQDSIRNCLSAYCYWTARDEGMSGSTANNIFCRATTVAKKEYLSDKGIIFDDLPNWQKGGTGAYWVNYIKQGYNPKENIPVFVDRREVFVDPNLETGMEYGNFIRNLVELSEK